MTFSQICLLLTKRLYFFRRSAAGAEGLSLENTSLPTHGLVVRVGAAYGGIKLGGLTGRREEVAAARAALPRTLAPQVRIAARG